MKRSVLMAGLAAAILAAPVLVSAQPQRPERGARGQAGERAEQRVQRFGVEGQRTPGGGRGNRGGFAPPIAPANIPPALNPTPAVVTLPPAVTTPPAKPGVVDPLAGMGRKISAVLDISTAPRLLITETEYGVSDTSDLVVGQEYRDGWRLSAVNPTSITMKKGEEQRQIALNFNTGAGRGPLVAPPPGNPGGGASGAQGAPGRGGAFSLSNGAGQAPAGRGPAPGAGGVPTISLGQLGINPAQLQQLQGQFQSALANLPPEVANDPRAAAALSALQNGNLGDLVTQFQGAFGAAGAGGGGAAAPFVLRLGPGGVPAPAP